MKKYLLVGCSRGLGFEVAKKIITQDASFLLVSRSMSRDSCNEFISDNVDVLQFDCTKENTYDNFFKTVSEYSPTHIYYFSGGGPYGLFSGKEFKDHLWAYKLNLLFPAELLHYSLKNLNCQQIIFTGSSVAENKVDELAASYSSAKHGLRGLIKTVQSENQGLDLRLFSPSYMSTKMLPEKASVYERYVVDTPQEIAELFCSWSENLSGKNHFLVDVRSKA